MRERRENDLKLFADLSQSQLHWQKLGLEATGSHGTRVDYDRILRVFLYLDAGSKICETTDSDSLVILGCVRSLRGLYVYIIAQVQTLLNFSCIDGCRS